MVVGPMGDLSSKADAVEALYKKDPKSAISIIIDSPGGSVFGSMPLLQAVERVRSRGTAVICAVTGQAMSMALHLMASCTKNFIMPTSLLMYHPVSMSMSRVRLTEETSKEIYKQLNIISNYLDKKLRRRLGISEELFNEYHRGEFIQYGFDFVDHAPGFSELIIDIRFK